MNIEWWAVIFRRLNMTTNPYSKSVNKNSLGIFKVAFNRIHGTDIEYRTLSGNQMSIFTRQSILSETNASKSSLTTRHEWKLTNQNKEVSKNPYVSDLPQKCPCSATFGRVSCCLPWICPDWRSGPKPTTSLKLNPWYMTTAVDHGKMCFSADFVISKLVAEDFR